MARRNMQNYIFWTLMLAIGAVLSVGITVFARAYLGGTTPSALLFRPKSERRLEVVEHTSLDGRRKLVLIRRDDVEHLLMTGGPVDVVIETGITAAQKRLPETAIRKDTAVAPRLPSFARGDDPSDQKGGAPQL